MNLRVRNQRSRHFVFNIIKDSVSNEVLIYYVRFITQESIPFGVSNNENNTGLGYFTFNLITLHYVL